MTDSSNSTPGKERKIFCTVLCCTDGHKLWLELDDTETHTLKTLSIRQYLLQRAIYRVAAVQCWPPDPEEPLPTALELLHLLCCAQDLPKSEQKNNNGSDIAKPLGRHPV